MVIEIVSSDPRYIEINRLFCKAGYDSKICRADEVGSPDALILSVRRELDDSELKTSLMNLKKGARVFTGTPNEVGKYFDGEILDSLLLEMSGKGTAEGVSMSYDVEVTQKVEAAGRTDAKYSSIPQNVTWIEE